MKRYIIKCDLSGIQDFIFDVKSDGAAKELKKRSIYVSRLTEKLLDEDRNRFGDDCEIIYNGGGNYFISLWSNEDIASVKNYYAEKSRQYIKDDLLPFFAVAKFEDDFSKAMDDVNLEMLRVKQRREISLVPYFNSETKLAEIIKGSGINFHFPKDEKGYPIDFDQLAKNGLGDKKLAALKMDVDHLGNVFRNRKKEEYEFLSNCLNDFFDHKLLELFQANKYSNQIYVVFSGGDDCFLIGCWHTMVELALKIREAFDVLNNVMNAKVNNLGNITISAGLSIFPPKYPVKQIAEETDRFLGKSKRAGRNRITILGHTLTWNEYRSVSEIKNQLFDLVDGKGESRSLIQRVISSELGYLSLQRNMQDRGLLDMPKVWKLKYYLRNVNDGNRNEVAALFDDYIQSLIHDFMKKENATNPIKYPIAARLAELLLKQSKYD